MKPIDFEQSNKTYAKNQEPYLPLPVWEGENKIIHCWKISLLERIKLLLTGKLWIYVMNFKQPPQPIKPMVDSPFNHSA